MNIPVRSDPARANEPRSATVEIEVTPPGPPGTRPWWTVWWDGTRATARSAPGLDGDEPADWGIPYLAPDYTDAWHCEGGTPYVVEQLLDGFGGHGARARIAAVHGTPEARNETLGALRAFADEHPQCTAELRRFARETERHTKAGANR